MSSSAILLQPPSNSISVIACVDDSAHSRNVASVGASLAEALDLPLTLLHVIEAGSDLGDRPDPIDWSLRRQQARRLLARISEHLSLPDAQIRLEVAEGNRVQTISNFAASPGSILVLGARGHGERRNCHGHTAQHLLEMGAGPMLLVPTGTAMPYDPFERIMVPLDGSSYAEAALAEAIRLARRSSAELLLAHVVPDAGLVMFGPPETTDLELRLEIDRRNEEAACNFLERTRRRLSDMGIKVRSRCFKGDTRSTLLRAIIEEKPDLIILSSRGQGGKSCHDLSLGGTAAYLMAHLTEPMMLVHPAAVRSEQPLRATIQTRSPASAFAA